MRRKVLENSRAPSGRLGFLLPTCRGNLRTPSAGKGNRLSNRKSTSHNPSATNTNKTRSLRSLVTAPCRLLAFAAGAPAGGASPRSFVAPAAAASRPHSALSGCRPLLHYGRLQPPSLRSRLHIFFRHPHQSPRERSGFRSLRSRLPLATLAVLARYARSCPRGRRVISSRSSRWGFRSRRLLPQARLRFVWSSLLICLPRGRRVVVAAFAGAPAPLDGSRPFGRSPASPSAPRRSSALTGAAPLRVAIRALRARALRYASGGYCPAALVGLPR